MDVQVVVDFAEWPEENRTAWGGWSPLRGALMPGTVIFSTTLTKD